MKWEDIRRDLLEHQLKPKGTILGIPDRVFRPQLIWHEVFLTGEVRPDMSVKEAVAIGCMGWAACHMGSKPPANFGMGMAKLSQISGCVLPEDFSTKADEIIKEKNCEHTLD